MFGAFSLLLLRFWGEERFIWCKQILIWEAQINTQEKNTMYISSIYIYVEDINGHVLPAFFLAFFSFSAKKVVMSADIYGAWKWFIVCLSGSSPLQNEKKSIKYICLIHICEQEKTKSYTCFLYTYIFSVWSFVSRHNFLGINCT